MLVALESAVRERSDAWSVDREIAAIAAEIQHAHLLTFLKANGAKQVGKPFRFPRPWEKPAKPKPMSMGAFARAVKGVPHAE